MSISAEEAQILAEKGTIFGYPLLLMDITCKVGTAASRPTPEAAKTPINQLVNLVFLPDHTFRVVVRPNVDTLYSIVFFDLRHEPMVLSLPDTGDRYYLMEVLDAWTDVIASPGTRVNGPGPYTFALAGPDWQGEAPEGIEVIKAPTNMCWMIGRTQINGPEDLPAVRELVGQYKLVPLSAWGTDYVAPEVPVGPGVDLSDPPAQVENMDAVSFFQSLAGLMVDNPPDEADAPMLAELKGIGLEPGRFEPDPGLADALEAGKAAALEQMKAKVTKVGEVINGWNVMLHSIGTYGTDYLARAAVALFGLGANIPEDAVYPSNPGVDSGGQPLDSQHKYVLHFENEATPPANAFWSLTMYDLPGYLVDNPIRRYAIGDRDDLKFNDDGSLDIYIQRQSPVPGKEGNWLPSPAEGAFSLLLRIYWPKQEMLNGSWKPPGVQRV